jgi:hypothetical protein
MLRDAAYYKSGSKRHLQDFLSLLNCFMINGGLDRPAKLNPFQRGLYDFMLLHPTVKIGSMKSAIKRHGWRSGTISSRAAMKKAKARADRNDFREVFEEIASAHGLLPSDISQAA